MILLFTVIDSPTFEIILVSIAASMWCLGVWTVTESGKLLAFIKQPLLNIIEKRTKTYHKSKHEVVEKFQKLMIKAEENDKKYYRKQQEAQIEIIEEKHQMFKKNMKLLNPIILCPVCMGSVHGFVVFSMFQPMSLWVIPVMIMTAGLNKLWHEKLF